MRSLFLCHVNFSSQADIKRKLKDKAKLRKEKQKKGESLDDISDDDELEAQLAALGKD